MLAYNTPFTLASWPWPSHGRARFCLHWASFTLAKLVNIAETVSARVKCKHTPTPSELFCSYVVHVNKGKVWRRPGQAKCKWDISPTMHDLPSQCKSEGSPGHGAKLARVILAKAWSG